MVQDSHPKLVSPISVTPACLVAFSRPAPLSQPSAALTSTDSIPTASRRPAHPAGIQARHHQLAAQQRVHDFNTNIANLIIHAMNTLGSKCIMCWMYHKPDWQGHSSDDCPKRIGTHYGDLAYRTFRSTAIRLPDGWCFSCLIHQVSVFISPNFPFTQSLPTDTYGPSFHYPSQL